MVPARLLGKRVKTGGKWEGLFVRELPDGCWEMLSQTRGTVAEGELIEIEPSTQRKQSSEPDPLLALRARRGSQSAAW